MTKGEWLETLLAENAKENGLGSPADLEAADALFLVWADTRHDSLGGGTPKATAAAMDLEEILEAVREGASLRGGAPPRLLAEELLFRLDWEVATQPDADQFASPTLANLAVLAMAEPELPDESAAACLAAVEVLRRWHHPAAVRWLLPVLASEDIGLRRATAIALGETGLLALQPIMTALSSTRDEHLRLGLFASLTRLPRHPDVTAALRQCWAAAGESDHRALAEGIGHYGDPELAPLLVEGIRTGPPSRYYWATYRVALLRLGEGHMPVPPPPPFPDNPEADLLAGCHALLEGDLTTQAREWLQEGLLTMDRRIESEPEKVNWFVYEQFQEMADQLWRRGSEAALTRFAEYAVGALQFYGALRVRELSSLVAIATGMSEPEPDELMPFLVQDQRLRRHPRGIIALQEVEHPEHLLGHRDEGGLPPALLSIGAMALAARGLMKHTWGDAETAAAQTLMRLLPDDLADADQVADLQRAMRGGHGNEGSLAALRDWLRKALDRGVEPDQELKDALADLWNHTARWDLFGHTPWSANQIADVISAQENAVISHGKGCACGSGKPHRLCCGRRH